MICRNVPVELRERHRRDKRGQAGLVMDHQERPRETRTAEDLAAMNPRRLESNGRLSPTRGYGHRLWHPLEINADVRGRGRPGPQQGGVTEVL